MSLDDSYLTYANRRHGQDIERYDWQLASRREPLKRADGVRVSAMIVVPCEFQPINPSKAPFNHPHGMITPYPDLRHFTTRDYGNRVGAFRILRALRETGARATFPVSAALLDRARPLIDAILADGHEIAAAGLHGDAIHHEGLSEDDERARVGEVRSAFSRAGLEPVAWLSPARQQSSRTPDLIREAGFTICLDWETDQIPLAMRTAHGPLTCLPLHTELDDFKLLNERKQDEDSWVRQIHAARDFLDGESAARGASVFGFSLTPFVAGQPFRYRDLVTMFEGLVKADGTRTETASEIKAAFGA